MDYADADADSDADSVAAVGCVDSLAVGVAAQRVYQRAPYGRHPLPSFFLPSTFKLKKI